MNRLLDSVKCIFYPNREDKKVCEFCGTELEFENRILTSCPPQYPYVCPKCGAHYNYTSDGRRYYLAKWGNKAYFEKDETESN